jgi:MFS family permease
VLIPIRGELGGFPTAVIGALGTLYYVGFIAGCVILPPAVRRFGHIRCYAALAAIAASLMLFQALFVLSWVWLGLRAALGFSLAGLFMVI